MSYDVLVEGGGAIQVGAWVAAARDLGVTCEFPADFVPVAWLGWLPVRMQVLDSTLFERAGDLAALGPLLVGFSFEVGAPAADTPAVELSAHMAARDERLARLVSVAAPEAVVEKERARVLRARALLAGGAGPEPAHVTLSVPARSTAADYVAAVFCAGALAQSTGGRLVDTWAGAGWSGDSIIAAAPRMVQSIGLGDDAFDPARLQVFDGWTKTVAP
jgi:hypothetical protein